MPHTTTASLGRIGPAGRCGGVLLVSTTDSHAEREAAQVMVRGIERVDQTLVLTMAAHSLTLTREHVRLQTV